MIVLDTNVVSEMMRAAPNAQVETWLNAQWTDTLWLNSVVVEELLFCASRFETKGRPIDVADTQIAAMCLVQDAPLATRNTKHFEGLGLRAINPWL